MFASGALRHVVDRATSPWLRQRGLCAELLADEHAERPLLAAVNVEVDVDVRSLLKDILLSLAKAAARDTASAEPWVELLAAVVQGGGCWGGPTERGAGAGGGPGLDAGAGGSVAQEGVDGLAMAEEGRLEDIAEGTEAARSGRLDAIGSFGGAVGSPRAPAVRPLDACGAVCDAVCAIIAVKGAGATPVRWRCDHLMSRWNADLRLRSHRCRRMMSAGSSAA